MKNKKKITKFGKALLRDPILNKGTAFSREERKQLGISGFLPDRVSTMEDQLERRLENFNKITTAIEKYEFLTSIQNRNETLFYRFAQDHIEEVLPYIYTPTVGEASLNFSTNYHSSRGVYIPYYLEDEIEDLLRSSEMEDVAVIVATDGGSVLGLGDVGIGGMVISIGKCALYTIFGGINPSKCLPIFLDAGTNNEELLNDKKYIGLREKRISNEKYFQFMDRFVKAVKNVYPKALLQWEDLERNTVFEVLSRYRYFSCSFNDDIQGTAATSLAGILSAIRIKKGNLKEEKIVIFGPGSAGMGIADILVDYLIKNGTKREVAHAQIYLIDKNGLVYENGALIPEYQKPYAKTKDEIALWQTQNETITLLETIKGAKITTLIGTSAQVGAFSSSVLEAISENTERPIIFPLSNPTSKSEAHPEDIFKYTKGKAIIATGSPYAPFQFDGIKVDIPQCNNVNIFPAIGLATLAFQISSIPNEIFMIAGETLSTLEKKRLFPKLSDLREKTVDVAIAIGQYAASKRLIPEMSVKEMRERIEEVRWEPKYIDYEI